MRYVVTGSAGFIGHHLCQALLESGAAVDGLDAFTDYCDPSLKRANAARPSLRRSSCPCGGVVDVIAERRPALCDGHPTSNVRQGGGSADWSYGESTRLAMSWATPDFDAASMIGAGSPT